MSVPQVSTPSIRYTDLAVAVAILGTVVMMIIPLPSFLLDMMLIINITIAMILLLVTIFIQGALEISVFPSLLLITTLFRLSLNVSSTRLVLLNGYAGEVIEKFGTFVLAGNPVVGFVVFLILVIIQFIVITKGAERVAEVAARFTLDAMPGKQMAIDADLNAGMINEAEAKRRRKDIQREADFFGAMDGATKFVKGDAIAGIIIVAINVIGGFIIGVLQKGLSISQAALKYTILTVGDGLVTQIPALLISTATGIIVTRAASESNLAEDLRNQLFNYPRVLQIAAGMLALLGLIGLPPLPLLSMSGVLFFLGYRLSKEQKESVVAEMEKAQEKEIEEIKKPENVISLLDVDPLELEMGYALIPLVDTQQGGDLLDRVIMIRRQCALELGLIVPPIRLRDNMQLKPSAYSIKIKGVEVAGGELLIDHYLAMSPGYDDGSIGGIDTKEPAFGLPAKWIPSQMRDQAELAGYTVVDPPSVVATHLTEVIKSHAAEVLGRQDVQTLLDHVKQSNPTVVSELIPDLMTVGDLQKVLAGLLNERVPIRDLVTIMESLADHARMTKDPDIWIEYARQALARQIVKPYLMPGTNQLNVITLNPMLENKIREAIQQTEQGSYLALDPMEVQIIANKLVSEVERVTQMGYQPVVLCAPIVRLYFKRMTERVIPQLVVLSYNEVGMQIEVQSIGMVS
ncbi:flagellar biosynthesis protein FlhA [Heliophilum fasciatum]|uniref:Flagellar biosynthesis protein FlhA n=1 Tax=Heliophilum fasciatum TaxID=35700 RepID=A0A4R2RZH6_9FIRM|nr:flagellar biosynthesis protein FlhA [Heliophilum fasciatum]MCW2277925.1 flagellar biosynthesis protein FlhA [Heliophilum fasciatum]TCP64505.1 flagellar biosynthesis protein FlhA [Heliophilum fasciatum]